VGGGVLAPVYLHGFDLSLYGNLLLYL